MHPFVVVVVVVLVLVLVLVVLVVLVVIAQSVSRLYATLTKANNVFIRK